MHRSFKRSFLSLVVTGAVVGAPFLSRASAQSPTPTPKPPFRMTVTDVFDIKNRGLIVMGKVELGKISVGDTVALKGKIGNREVTVKSIEKFQQKDLKTVEAGPDDVGLGLSDLKKADVPQGAVLENQ